MGQYDWLYELRPIPIKQELLQQLAKQLAEELRAWPPALDEWARPEDAARYERAAAAPPPPQALLRYAFKIARLDLQREFEAIDAEMRNERWRAHAAPGPEYEQLQLLIQWLVHVLLMIQERVESALTRRDLVHALDLVEARVAPSPLRA